MNDKELIKEKLKEGKKKAKINKTNDKKKQGKKFSIIVTVIIAIIQVATTFAIPQNAKWFGISMTLYMLITTRAIICLLQTFLEERNYANDRKVVEIYYIASTVAIFIAGFIRKFGFLTYLLPVLNYWLGSEVGFSINSEIFSAILFLHTNEKLAQKAIKMQLRKMIILLSISPIIFALTLGTFYQKQYTGKEVLDIIIVAIVAAIIMNLIGTIILKVVSKRKEKLLNAAFGLKMGEEKYTIETSINYYPRVIHNFAIMYYRAISLIIIFITLLIFTKVDMSISILITSVYHIVTIIFPRYKEDYILTVTENTVANIYDSDGNKMGSIKK